MKRCRKTYGLLVAILLVGLFATSCSKKIAHEGSVVFTQVPANSVSEDQLKNHNFRYASGMKIAMAEIGETLENIKILTMDFHSARSPEISYDGKCLVFSGQKAAGDVWQIWKLNLDKSEINQVTQFDQNCTDPTWLPNERVAYSKQVESEKALKFPASPAGGHGLFSCNLDGSDEQRITFQPHEDLSASVTNDGRLLVSSKQVYPDEGSLKYLAVHPDGTKAELFYQAEKGSKSMSKAWETINRKLIFVESENLVSIDFNRPLNSRKIISQPEQGLFLSVFSIDEQQVLASVRKQAESTFGLILLNLSTPEGNGFYFNDASYHAVEPVVVMLRPVPRKLPTTVNMDRESGYFFCMDADRSDIEIAFGASSKIQVLGMDKVLGETTIEEDGSFYLEIKADQPIRFQTLNEEGEVLRGPSSWMWVRPNERRGCTGCHENRELSPENFVPLAIEKPPVAMIK